MHQLRIPSLSTALRDLAEVREKIQPLTGLLAGVVDVLDRARSAVREAARGDRVFDRIEAALTLPIPAFFQEIRSASLLDGKRVLLICDQFEELFIHYAGSPRMNSFIQELGALWADPDFDLHILFSMREDWVGSMIELRRAIPDVFSYYFKLNPLTAGGARAALTEPLKDREESFGSETVDVIMADLSRCYAAPREEAQVATGVDAPSTQDAHIELPALQVVADALWQTRQSHDRPFSSDHYFALPSFFMKRRKPWDEPGGVHPSDVSNPAAWLLMHYLDHRLEVAAVRDDKRLTAREWQELRLDCMYLLTDRTRHRRALSDADLLRQLAEVRPQSLGLAEIDRPLLRAAIAPLVDVKLISRHPHVGDGMQYELAHDFVVRSVVRRWREQERSRAAELAVREQRARYLEEQDRRVLGVLRILPVSGIFLMLITAGINQWFGGEPSRFDVPAAAFVLSLPWACLMVFTSVLVLAILSRHWPSIWMAGGGVLGVGGLSYCETALALTSGWDGVAGSRVVDWGDDLLWASKVFLLPTAIFLVYSLLWSVRDVADRLGEIRLHFVLSVLWAELVDITLLMAFGFLGEKVGASIDGYGGRGEGLIAGVVLWWLMSVALFLWKSTSPGLLTVGLEVGYRHFARLRVVHAIFRQLFFLTWEVLCIVGLSVPWLLVGPLVLHLSRRRQPLYDLLAGTELRCAGSGSSMDEIAERSASPLLAAASTSPNRE